MGLDIVWSLVRIPTTDIILTIETCPSGIVISMKTILLLLSTSFFLAPVRAMDEKAAAKELLRDGLFEEEANGDFKKAAAAYEELIKRYDVQRRYAGTALLRLAEIARKTGDAERARVLYTRVAREFSDHEALVAKAKEHLPAAGGQSPLLFPGGERARPGVPARTKEETDELTRLYKLRDQSPDRLDGIDEKGLFPIHRAAEKGWVEALELLLHHKVDVDVRSSEEFTPLQLAVIHGHLTVVDLLIKAGAKLDLTVSMTPKQMPIPVQGLERGKVNRWSVTHLAVLYKRREILTRLLEAKVPTDVGSAVVAMQWVWGQRNSGKETSVIASPLMLAIDRNDKRSVDLLLEGGADINLKVAGQYSALSMAVHSNSEMVPYLLKKGALVTDDLINGYSLLHRAVVRGRISVVKLLLEKVSDLELTVNYSSEFEPVTVLELAVREFNERSRPEEKEIILALLERGSKATPKTILDATKKGELWMVKALLGAGAKVNPEEGETGPIHEIRTVAIAKLLLDAGADPNQRDRLGFPPLLRVFMRLKASAEYTGLVDLLLERGAKTTEISANSRKDVEHAIWRLNQQYKFEPAAMQYFMEKVVYPDLPMNDRIQVVTSRDWLVYDGEQRFFDDSAAPNFLQLLMMAGLLPEQSLGNPKSTDGPKRRVRRVPASPTAGREWIQSIRVFRKSSDGRVMQVSELKGKELTYQGLPKLEWGDVVEFDWGLGSWENSKKGLLLSGCWSHLKPVTIVQQVGPWEGKRTLPASRSKFPSYRFSDGRVFDFEPNSQWAHNSTEITVRRGEKHRTFKNQSSEIPSFRLAEGDRVEFAPLKELSSPKGIHMFFPHHPVQSYRMGTTEASLLEMLSHLKFRSSIDYAAIEIHRVVDGERQVTKVNLVGRVRDRKEEDFEKVDVSKLFPDRVKTDDVIVLPPRAWTGSNEEKVKRTAEHEHLAKFLMQRAGWEYDYSESNR